jgi:hypothetical protein
MKTKREKRRERLATMLESMAGPSTITRAIRAVNRKVESRKREQMAANRKGE